MLLLFSFSAIIFPFTPITLTTQKMKISKQWKTPDLHKCTKNNDQMLHCSWDMARVGCPKIHVPKIMIIYVIVPEIWPRTDVIVSFPFGLFYALYPLTARKIKISEKWKKIAGDVIILHNCTKNHDHMLYCSWHMVCEGCNWYFSF